MVHNSVGFIGGGRIVRILLAGWQRGGTELTSIVVSDIDQAALERLPNTTSRLTKVVGDSVAAAQQDIVFLALHPPALPETLAQIAPALESESIVVSLAPKLTMSRITGLLGGFDRIARVIPNAPSVVGRGFNPVAFGPSISAEDRSRLQQLFAPLGEMPCVEENTLEAYAVVAAMGPTYIWPQLVELISIAESFGIEHSEAMSAVRSMVDGATATLAESGLTAEEVLNLVPVRPMADFEPALRDAYRTKLAGIMARIRP